MRDPIHVTLARDPFRIIAWLLVRLAVAEVGIVVGLSTPGSIGVAVTLAGVAVLVYVALLALHVLSLRLELRPGEVRVASAIAGRTYPLQRGAVTRLPPRRRSAIFGTQLGAFGIEIGAGFAPSKEPVDVVRLAPGTKMVLIPTSPRRLAVAPSSEPVLLRALEHAAQGIGVDTRRVVGQEVESRASR